MRLSAIKDTLPIWDNVEFRSASGWHTFHPKEQTDRLSCRGCFWHASGAAEGNYRGRIARVARRILRIVRR